MSDDAVNILVVDDLPDKLLAYQTILEDLGQRLLTARSGEEALGLVLRHEFAVILLDVNMPGMSGPEAATLIRQRKRSAHTPIIFLTAFADEVRVAEGYAQGAVDYILTPVVPDILRAKVRVFVELYRMAQQVRRQAVEQVALAEERGKRAVAEEATRRSQFLAEVSRALGDSLDPDVTAAALAGRLVPFLADFASVILASESGRPWRAELAWAVPAAAEPGTSRVARPDVPPDALWRAVERALGGGPTEYLDDLDVPFPTADAVGRLRSAAVVPLLARGRILGALVLAYGSETGRRRGLIDPALVDDLAGRAAIALDNARLYRKVEAADRQKNEFLSMLAHELRNPLAPVHNAVRLLQLKVPDHPDVGWATGVIDRQVTHMVRLVDDLLDVSRITQGKIHLQSEPIELVALLRQVVEDLGPVFARGQQRVEIDLPAGPLFVPGDRVRLVQVFANLMTNAAKYTDTGGRIRLSAAGSGDEVEVRVRDSGMGIATDMLESVFDLFVQAEQPLDRSRGGLGIGLTLVRRLVELHGGAVSAASDGPGTGSEFVVRLPLVPVGRAPAQAPAGPGAIAPGRVLIAEDNTDTAESLALLLRSMGYELQVAHDGPGAVAAAVEFRPDVAILDIGLPGMSGYEVARRLRAALPSRPLCLVATTGYGREEDRQMAAAAGFDHHLTKPVEFQLLLEVLASAGERAVGPPSNVE
jgi:signal transduction histidine kinase/DNA-binding response OmpR family regulator